ncbi:hypothetical protein A3K82_03275 [Candidatus Pacearchaeota archaeon RBG_19FT_COMBO_34_9]|nr:MAG: hypothetical protein A3K82_03275 [Candidatus Pacearchaeota archaeon RBG_19FT_COMBO_34_9]OGJ15933.1 MAG: hypothetical protein A3K74_02445 [Candidatus Pacearchaeota archaeon RBG_13_33_26]
MQDKDKQETGRNKAIQEQDKGLTGNNEPQPIFLNSKVKHSKDKALKTRLQTLINALGLSEPDFYNPLGYSKQVWYAISWGIWEPTIKQKVRISQTLGVDSSVIWESSKEDTAPKINLNNPESKAQLNPGKTER